MNRSGTVPSRFWRASGQARIIGAMMNSHSVMSGLLMIFPVYWGWAGTGLRLRLRRGGFPGSFPPRRGAPAYRRWTGRRPVGGVGSGPFLQFFRAGMGCSAVSAAGASMEMRRMMRRTGLGSTSIWAVRLMVGVVMLSSPWVNYQSSRSSLTHAGQLPPGAPQSWHWAANWQFSRWRQHWVRSAL